MSPPLGRPDPGRPLVIDGGLATTLEARGHALHGRLWSAGLFLERPDAVAAVHREFLEAGAEILITASYQMSFEALAQAGLAHDAAAAALAGTVEIARRAARGARPAPLVAASVGPWGAAQADGSEYTGAYDVSAHALAEFHRERLAVLSASGADLVAVETVPSFAEARILAELLAESDGPPAWISFCCRDGRHIADGTPLAQAAAVADRPARVVAVGVNCTDPEQVAELIEMLRVATAKPIVVYPNSGERWDPAARRFTGQPAGERFVELARGWARQGAWAIGGCCRVGPAAIGRLRRALAG